ncbi:MAG: tetratricopeptide repeat protein [Chthoniobacteraceae bacterium]
MFRSFIHAFAIFIFASAARGVPVRDPVMVMREFQRTADQKQLWLVPDPAREFTGDFIARLRKQGADGDSRAQATLGLCHHLGVGVKRDLPNAIVWYRKAAARGHPGAQNNLGAIYDEGSGVPRDPAKAHELYLSAAKMDFAEAQFNVGVNFATGTAVAQDWGEAAAWYRKAAAQGHLPASNNLGNIYFFGRGVPVDLEVAKKYLRPPADAGLAVSQFGLGAILMEEGKLEEAASLFRASAEGGYPGGQFLWAASLMEGKGVPRDPKTALKWARLAVEKLPDVLSAKTAEAQALVGQILLDENPGIPPDPKEAYRWARKSADQGCARGQNLVGLCYHRGVGVEANLATAIKWYRLAAEQKEPAAAYNLGFMLENGTGTARDFSEAAKWYQIAAEAGNPLAQYRLGLFYRDGTGVDVDLAKAAEWLRLSVTQTNDREARMVLSDTERQLGKQPAEIEFRRGLELGQQGEKGADSWKEAREHLSKAADLGHPYATAILAGMIRRGNGASPDDATAEALIVKVEKTTDPILLHMMSMSYIVDEKIAPKYITRAMEFSRRAALQGYPPAQNTFGFQLMSGADGPPDFIEALKWLTLSAKQGNPDAKVNLTRLQPKLTEAQITEGTRRADGFLPQRE